MSLIEIINFCDKEQYDVFCIKTGEKWKAVIWKADKVFKTGTKEYKTWQQAQKETYLKLYKALTK